MRDDYPAKADEAEKLLTLLPDGKTQDDKFWIGLFDDGKIIAFVDIVQNYKKEGEWTLGIYLVDKNYRGKAIATRLFIKLEDLLLSLKATNISIVVQEQNKCGFAFWQKMNFK